MTRQESDTYAVAGARRTQTQYDFDMAILTGYIDALRILKPRSELPLHHWRDAKLMPDFSFDSTTGARAKRTLWNARLATTASLSRWLKQRPDMVPVMIGMTVDLA